MENCTRSRANRRNTVGGTPRRAGRGTSCTLVKGAGRPGPLAFPVTGAARASPSPAAAGPFPESLKRRVDRRAALPLAQKGGGGGKVKVEGRQVDKEQGSSLRTLVLKADPERSHLSAGIALLGQPGSLFVRHWSIPPLRFAEVVQSERPASFPQFAVHPERPGLADSTDGGNMSVAFAAPRQRGKGEITPAAIQKVKPLGFGDARPVLP